MPKLILLFFCWITFPAIAQDKKDLCFSFAIGPSISFEYKNPKANNFKSFDMDYYFQRRHILSSNYYCGENTLPPVERLYSEQSAHYTAISLLYKYRVIDKPKFSFLAGTGWGMLSHGIDTLDIWKDYVIPIRVECIFNLSNHINASLIGGFFIMPDIPVVSYYLGPRISYVFK
jgi:hypothetical protein